MDTDTLNYIYMFLHFPCRIVYKTYDTGLKNYPQLLRHFEYYLLLFLAENDTWKTPPQKYSSSQCLSFALESTRKE